MNYYFPFQFNRTQEKENTDYFVTNYNNLTEYVKKKEI